MAWMKIAHFRWNSNLCMICIFRKGCLREKLSNPNPEYLWSPQLSDVDQRLLKPLIAIILGFIVAYARRLLRGTSILVLSHTGCKYVHITWGDGLLIYRWSVKFNDWLELLVVWHIWSWSRFWWFDVSVVAIWCCELISLLCVYYFLLNHFLNGDKIPMCRLSLSMDDAKDPTDLIVIQLGKFFIGSILTITSVDNDDWDDVVSLVYSLLLMIVILMDVSTWFRMRFLFQVFWSYLSRCQGHWTLWLFFCCIVLHLFLLLFSSFSYN